MTRTEARPAIAAVQDVFAQRSDGLHEIVRAVVQEVLEAKMTDAVGAEKGGGLAEAITLALNAQIKNGNYAKVLAHWGSTSERIDQSRTNPPGLPKS